MKKKNNYKPRIMEFDHTCGQSIRVDTRKGYKGIYPGDEYRLDAYGKVLVLGVDCNTHDLVFAYDSPCWGAGVNYDYADLFDNNHVIFITRHAQHLIDSGEMIQAE